MIGKAFDRHLPLGDADDAFDNADIDLFGVEDAALLDVQLEVRGNITALAADAYEPIGIAAYELDSVANRLATVTNEVELLVGDIAAEGVTANRAALFVGEDDNFQRVPNREFVFRQCLRNFDRAQRANIPVEVAALGHRVDVRAHHQGLQSRFAPAPPSDDVARGVDADVESSRAHQAHNILAPLAIGFAEGDPAHAALRVLAKL